MQELSPVDQGLVLAPTSGAQCEGTMETGVGFTVYRHFLPAAINQTGLNPDRLGM